MSETAEYQPGLSSETELHPQMMCKTLWVEFCFFHTPQVPQARGVLLLTLFGLINTDYYSHKTHVWPPESVEISTTSLISVRTWKSVADTLNGYNQRLNHKHIKDFP